MIQARKLAYSINIPTEPVAYLSGLFQILTSTLQCRFIAMTATLCDQANFCACAEIVLGRPNSPVPMCAQSDITALILWKHKAFLTGMVPEPGTVCFKVDFCNAHMMQNLELGNTSPADLKSRRRSHRHTSSSRAYLASWRQRLALQNLQQLKARFESFSARVLKALPVLLTISLAAVTLFAAWIVLVVLYEIVLGFGMVPPKS